MDGVNNIRDTLYPLIRDRDKVVKSIADYYGKSEKTVLRHWLQGGKIPLEKEAKVIDILQKQIFKEANENIKTAGYDTASRVCD